jgi:hypothetical protein
MVSSGLPKAGVTAEAHHLCRSNGRVTIQSKAFKNNPVFPKDWAVSFLPLNSLAKSRAAK